MHGACRRYDVPHPSPGPRERQVKSLCSARRDRLTAKPAFDYNHLVMKERGGGTRNGRRLARDGVSSRLDATFAALADPTRRAILARLAYGEATVNELKRPFAISQPAISKHLKVLERAGLITRAREAQRRPCRIRARPMQRISRWLAGYRRLWEPHPGRASSSREKRPARRNGT